MNPPLLSTRRRRMGTTDGRFFRVCDVRAGVQQDGCRGACSALLSIWRERMSERSAHTHSNFKKRKKEKAGAEGGGRWDGPPSLDDFLQLPGHFFGGRPGCSGGWPKSLFFRRRKKSPKAAVCALEIFSPLVKGPRVGSGGRTEIKRI